ncbi:MULTISPECIES: hypothetical protein [unclassified Mesorhizobium]|uniref:hypothetical protein n=1 Tax=unclassified Mesorhizobium TaxID=325217 RepID=UPI000FE51B83|nr:MULTISPECIES: hypothetical protein [unclassified Mesorhizobium]RWJ07229.1 MAG: hypothetical protein EOR23_07175 [Mesorhizobium sp.]TIR31169.1 MAG: hypothetical protein E5X35_18830 [Mesorhizobium sp.]
MKGPLSASLVLPKKPKSRGEPRLLETGAGEAIRTLAPTLETSISANATLSESPQPESEMVNTSEMMQVLLDQLASRPLSRRSFLVSAMDPLG